METASPSVAYFSMEIALEPDMPTYSGGLGALAGDTIRSAADLELPMVAVSLLYRNGYFTQHLDESGWQTETPIDWNPSDYLVEQPERTTVQIEGRAVQVRAWRFDVEGLTGHTVPVFFLDTDLPENTEWDRQLTGTLYGGDDHYRLCQETVLGIGGVQMLHALGYDQVQRFHMNEGHASLLTLALLDRSATQHEREAITRQDIETVREQCVFTTHTPVPAGHDKFSLDLVERVLDRSSEQFVDAEDPYSMETLRRILGMNGELQDLHEVTQGSDNRLNMTYLALNLSNYVNGVAKKHGEVSRLMFGDYPVDSITNGVHASSWVAEPFRALFDEHVPGWEEDNFSLRYALKIPREKIWEAHQTAKEALVDEVERTTGQRFDPNVFTIGFARRMTPYKRADLLISDLDRLRMIAERSGPLQIIYAGKAHPRDEEGKRIIQRIFNAKDALGNNVRIAYIPDYNKRTTRLMVSGSDVWLNTPKPPNEASGTSGMKAALNGVPHLSILDGWWLEGWIEGTTGWAIGTTDPETSNRTDDATSMYGKLRHVIVPKYYNDRSGYVDVMRSAIALNGSFFNTQRMVQQYVLKAYF
ncbi:MAG: alpha-glucan family phosphorylase [Bacteroidetes bacterium]|jgi:starch phosphorylase|nr:alpha-glucan family phosphorylase [Bacteroidota bacterium]